MKTWEIETEVKKADGLAAMGTKMLELNPGSFRAFEFNEYKSAKTTRTTKTNNIYEFDEESKFTSGPNADMS